MDFQDIVEVMSASHQEHLTSGAAPSMKTYSIRDANERASELKIHTITGVPAGYPSVNDLLNDYTRARMLISALLTNLDADKKYIERIDKLNDKLIQGVSNGIQL